LEIDEFRTYVGNKKNKLWLIYAYNKAIKEIVSYVWGRRNLKTVRLLKQKLDDFGVSYDAIFSDNRESFKRVFFGFNHIIGI
jgi:IS1 family transposase